MQYSKLLLVMYAGLKTATLILQAHTKDMHLHFFVCAPWSVAVPWTCMRTHNWVVTTYLNITVIIADILVGFRSLTTYKQNINMHIFVN